MEETAAGWSRPPVLPSRGGALAVGNRRSLAAVTGVAVTPTAAALLGTPLDVPVDVVLEVDGGPVAGLEHERAGRSWPVD
jgi:hypothetical protein